MVEGDDTVDAGAGTATIHLGQGRDTVVLNGRNDTGVGGTGAWDRGGNVVAPIIAFGASSEAVLCLARGGDGACQR